MMNGISLYNDKNSRMNNVVLGEEKIHNDQIKNPKYKIINDSVHGHIKLHELCVKIIDTQEFQRLRNIKQLGVANLVYPSAGHSRFEHSLGVCYLAGVMVDRLTESDKQWKKDARLLDVHPITATEKLCLEIAGLCHDLGHGPFSHTWERVVSNWEGESCGNGNSWKHEESSVEIFSNIASKLEDSFKMFGIFSKDIEFIKNIIQGSYENDNRKEKQFLYEIVANKKSKIDVDKWDYLLRDELHLNLNTTFNYLRLLEFCAVVKTDDGTYRLGFRDREINILYDMFRIRAEFHQKAYQHYVVKKIETMYIDAFVAAGDYFFNRRIKLRDAHKNSASFSQLTDHIYYNILYSVDEKTEHARKILQNVCTRHLYQLLGKETFFSFNKKDQDSRKKIKELKTELKAKFPHIYENFKISDIEIDLKAFDETNLNLILYKKKLEKKGDREYVPILTTFTRDMLQYPIESSQTHQLQLLLFYDNTYGDLDEETCLEVENFMKNLNKNQLVSEVSNLFKWSTSKQY